MRFRSIFQWNAAYHFIKESWALLVLVFSFLIFLFRVVWPSSINITYGFGAYYTASRLVMEARVEPILYDDDAFRTEVERDTHNKASDIFWANPPTTAIMFLPFAFLSPEAARILWIGLSVFFLILAILLLHRALWDSTLQFKILFIVVSGFLLSAPLGANFRYGQAYVLMLLLYSSALYALRLRMDWAAGFFLAMALALKASGLPLLIFLAIQGRWKLVGWTIFCFIGLAAFFLPILSMSLWQTYVLHIIPDFLADPVIAVTTYQTIPGFLHHLFVYDNDWNIAPLVNWPVYSVIVYWLIVILLLGMASVYSKHASSELMFCIGLLLSVILIPAAEEYHFILLFPAFLFVSKFYSLKQVSLLIAAALLAIPLNYASKEWSTGWLALLAYPRLYGAIVLYILLLSTAHESKTNSMVPGF